MTTTTQIPAYFEWVFLKRCLLYNIFLFTVFIVVVVKAKVKYSTIFGENFKENNKN